MDVKTLQQAINVAIKLDLKDAKANLDLNTQQHARAFGMLSPNLAKVLVAIGKLNVDKIQAEMN
jgi:hypothetical protein